VQDGVHGALRAAPDGRDQPRSASGSTSRTCGRRPATTSRARSRATTRRPGRAGRDGRPATASSSTSPRTNGSRASSSVVATRRRSRRARSRRRWSCPPGMVQGRRARTGGLPTTVFKPVRTIRRARDAPAKKDAASCCRSSRRSGSRRGARAGSSPLAIGRRASRTFARAANRYSRSARRSRARLASMLRYAQSHLAGRGCSSTYFRYTVAGTVRHL